MYVFFIIVFYCVYGQMSEINKYYPLLLLLLLLLMLYREINFFFLLSQCDKGIRVMLKHNIIVILKLFDKK